MSRVVVAIDGPSGVGKTTLMPLLVREFATRGLIFSAKSNVASSPLKALIRELAAEAQPGLALSVALTTSRALLLEREGGNLLFDRFVLSSLVYQTFSGINREYVYASNAPVMDQVVTIDLVLSAEELLTRRAARRNDAHMDYFKQHLTIDVELRLFAEGARLLRDRGHVVERIDAALPVADVARRIADVILSRAPADD